MTENSSESTVKQRKPPLPLPDSLDEFKKLFNLSYDIFKKKY